MDKLKEMVDDFLAQKRIAVVGVSTTTADAGDAIYDKLLKHGYQVYPVNPKTDRYKGVPCYPSVKDIPGGVQAAMLVLPPQATEKVVEECLEARVSHVWMHRSIGNSVSEKAVEFCRENGIAVIGGGCPMMFLEPDFGHVCMRWIGKWAGWLPTE